MNSIPQLLENVRLGGEEAVDASRTLGLILERERVRRPVGDDGGLSIILDDHWSTRRLNDQELQGIVDDLIEYVRSTERPSAMAVWALTKSYEPRIVPPLINLLYGVMEDHACEHLAYQALIGIINSGPGSENDGDARAAIRDASERGRGEVQETARDYLMAVDRG